MTFRARYIGDKEQVNPFGMRFPKGVFVEVNDEQVQAKLRGNPHFEIEAVDAEEVEFTETPRTEAAAPEGEEAKPATSRRARNAA